MGVEDHPYKKLEELALPAGDVKAEETFNSVRQQWFDACLKEAPPSPPPAGTYKGTTDSAVDIFNMNEIGDVSYNPANWTKHSIAMAAKLQEYVQAAADQEAARVDRKGAFDASYSTLNRNRLATNEAAREAAQSNNGAVPIIVPWMTPSDGARKQT